MTNRPIVDVYIHGEKYSALIDSGADMVLVSDHIPNLPIEKCAGITLHLATKGHEAPVHSKTRVPVTIGNLQCTLNAHVMRGMNDDIILGSPFLRQEKAIIDYDRCCVYLGAQDRQTIYWRMPSKQAVRLITLPTLEPNHPPALDYLIDEFQDLFETGLQQPTTRTTEHNIRLKDDAPINRHCYGMAPAKKQILYNQVDEMLRTGVIEPSTSAYSSPPVLVSREGKKPRFCVDYRLLNEKTIDESSTLPRIQDSLKALAQAKYFTVLDLKSGYWQIPLKPSAKHLTAFTTPDGAQYQFNVMPFGLKNAPSTFQKLMTAEVLVGMVQEFVQVYLDDIIVYSNTAEEHLYHVRLVFERLRLHNLKVSAEKCRIFQDSLDYLGYHINGSVVEPQVKHLSQIKEFTIPKNKKQLQSFIGTVNWLREHIPHLSEIMAPLTELLKCKLKKFTWDRIHDEAFDKVKIVAAQAKPLSRPDFTKKFILQTDASSIGMSAVLFQEDNGQRKIISYASAKFKEAERRYHVNEQECLALVWAINLYRAYLEDKPFTVRTDSRSLTWLNKFKDTKAKLTRWALILQEYSFNLEHVPGKANQLPDWLSRHPEEASYVPTPEDDRLLPPDHEGEPSDDQQEIFIAQVNVGTIYEKVARGQNQVRHIRRTIAALNLLRNQEPTTPSQRKLVKRFRVDEGLLWRIHPSGDRLVVPRHLIKQVIHAYHDLEDQAHPGLKETSKKICERYFWGWMYRDIQKYIHDCIPCSLAKPRQMQEPAPMHARSPSKPFEMLSVDVLGPYPDAVKTKNRFIVIIEDVFSKWVEAVALPEVLGRDIVEALETLITCRYGYPKYLVSDNGPQFKSKVLRKYCEDHDITKVFSSIFHQQANSVERRVQELKKVLRVLLLGVKPGLWETKLHKALQVLRSRTNRATEKSPAEIILGHPIACPGEWRTKWYKSRKEKTPRERKRLNREVFARQLDFQRKEYHNPEPPALVFQEGDKVNVRNFVPGAFAPAWTGPHTVVQRTGDTTYEVLVGGKQSNIHLNDLRPARTGNEVHEDESPYASSESSGEEFEFRNVEPIPTREPTGLEDTKLVNSQEPTTSSQSGVIHIGLSVEEEQPSTSAAQPPADLATVTLPEDPMVVPTQAQDAFRQILHVEGRVNELQRQVLARRLNKNEVLYFEEMFTRQLLELDNILNPGFDIVKTKRRSVIQRIESALQSLESPSH